MNDIVFSSTTQVAAAIRAGDVSASEVLEAYLAQIATHNPALNAVVTLDAEHARQRAREADEALAHGEVWGPLHGVPFTLKDAHATAGMRTTTGFPPLDHVPHEDSTVRARLKAAGGILIGKTNVFLSASLRIPAHFCGVFGLKPTEQRVPLTGLIPGLPGPRSVRIMSCIGPMARSAEDLALLYAIIAGPDGRDTDIQPVPVDEVPALGLKDLRIAVAPTFPGVPVAAEIRAAVAALAQQLAHLGVAVE